MVLNTQIKDISNFIITRHAAIRWRDRTKISDPVEMRKFWNECTQKVIEIKLKDFYLKREKEIFYGDAVHYQSLNGRWVFITNDHKRVLTVLFARKLLHRYINILQ